MNKVVALLLHNSPSTCAPQVTESKQAFLTPILGSGREVNTCMQKPITTFINRIITGDCIEVMQEMPEASIDFIATDPPYLVNYHTSDGRGYHNDNPNDISWLLPTYRDEVSANRLHGFGRVILQNLGRAVPNMAAASLTLGGHAAGSPAALLRPSPAMSHAPDILDVDDPDLGYDADPCP
jgi:hypothetical protein